MNCSFSRNSAFSLIITSVFLMPLGCDKSKEDHSQCSKPALETTAEKSNRIDIPPAVRRNLGITFATVEKRPVAKTIRIPGQFELMPKARREYRVMLTGRIELAVDQYDKVKAGDTLFNIDSPDWWKIQEELVAAHNAMRRSHAELSVAQAALEEAVKEVEFLSQRVKNLADANVRQVELEAELNSRQNTLPRLKAELQAAELNLQAAHTHYEVLLVSASSITGIPRDELDKPAGEHHHQDGLPKWSKINQLSVMAQASGIVDTIAITNSGWAETGDMVLDTLNPEKVRFHADALQTDINMFKDGQTAKIVPPPGGSIDLQDDIDGVLQVGYRAHSEQRTIPIFLVPAELPKWAKAGVTAYMDVFLDTSEMETAIPEACVVRDGLHSVFFRRDPTDPDKVIRVEADLGISDGRWIVVHSGVKAGDEIVLAGVYPLLLVSFQKGDQPAAGHFHADGTFHEKAH